MKKFFKTLAIMLLIVPCAFMFAACGKNNDPPPETAEQMYQKLLTVYAKDKAYTGSLTSEITSETITSYPGTEKEDEVDYAIKEYVTYDSTNKTYAEKFYYYNEETAGEDKYQLNYEIYVAKSGDKHILYEYWGENPNRSLVDDNYAPRLVENEIIDEISVVLNGADTLAKLKENLEKMFSYPGAQSQVSVTITENNGLYTAKVIMSLTVPVAQGINMESSNEMTIKYDANHIYSAEQKSTTTSPNFSNGNVSYEKEVSVDKIINKFSYDSSLMRENFGTFDDEPSARIISVCLYVADEDFYVSMTFGEVWNIEEVVQSANGYIDGSYTSLLDYLQENGLVIEKWYLDEDLTQLFNGFETAPSYNVELYASVKPEEGYALVQFEDVVLFYDEEGNLFEIPGADLKMTYSEAVKLSELEDNKYTIPTDIDLDDFPFVPEPGTISVNGVLVDVSNPANLTITLEEGKVYKIVRTCKVTITADMMQGM